ncbi:hypothetical protein GCM10028864_60760 [Microlunatus parietis]
MLGFRGRFGVGVAAVATLVLAQAVIMAGPAAAAETAAPRTFDSEPLGQPPAGATVQGSVAVVSKLGGSGRAVQLTDNTASLQTKAYFPAPAVNSRHYEFDLAVTAWQSASLFAIRGSGDNPGLGVFRFMITANASTTVISVYDGSAWRTLATEPISIRNTYRRFSVDATADHAAVSLNGNRHSTTIKASAGSPITGIEFVSAGTAPVGSAAQLDNLVMYSTVVALDPVGTQIRFPDVTKLQNGDLAVVYDSGAAHTNANEDIKFVTSKDGGVNWSSPRVIEDGMFGDQHYDARDPKISRLSDGTLLVSFFVTEWLAGGGSKQHGTHVIRSEDDGAHWSEPVEVDSAMDPDVSGGWNASHGAAVQLPNGDVLIPLYGKVPGDATSRATVVRSTDGGRTFHRANEVTVGSGGDVNFQEPNLSVLPDGSLACLIRMASASGGGIPARLSRSSDGGRTWSTPAITDIYASSHHQLVTSTGAILLTWGAITPSTRPTYGQLIKNPAGSWDGIGEIRLYDTTRGDQANPSSVEVSPGRFLTLGYDVSRRTLTAVFSTVANYD